MSNTRTAAVKAVPEFTTSGPRKVAKADIIPFKIDGEDYGLQRPKTASFAQAAMSLETGVAMTDRRNMKAMLTFCAQLLQYVVEEPPEPDMLPGNRRNPDAGKFRGQARIQERLNDPKDSLDLEELLPMFTKLLEAWFDRPTMSPRASSASRRPAARASRARTR